MSTTNSAETDERKPTNEQQRVLSWLKIQTDDDAFVVARAGTGKTTLLMQCAKELLGERAAFVAFNRSVAAELRQKIANLYGAAVTDDLPARATTLHGLGFRALRTFLPGPFRIDSDKYVDLVRSYLFLSVCPVDGEIHQDVPSTEVTVDGDLRPVDFGGRRNSVAIKSAARPPGMTESANNNGEIKIQSSVISQETLQLNGDELPREVPEDTNAPEEEEESLESAATELTLTRLGQGLALRALSLSRLWDIPIDPADVDRTAVTYDSLFSDLVSYSSDNGVATDGDDESQVMLTPRGRFLADVSDHIVKFLRLGLVDIEDAMALRECVMTSPYTDFSGRTASAGDLCLATSIAVRIVRRSRRYAHARRRSAEVGVVMTSPFNLDFVDMLWLPVVMTGSVALGEVEKFGWIFVDEAQDLSRVGVELVRMFRATHADSGRKGRIVAVGDPNQAIYGFAGADADAVRFLISPENNSDRQTEVMSLSTCFRCPTEPLRYAQCLVPDIVPNTGAPEGTVKFSAVDDATRDVLPRDLVLARSNKRLAEFEENRRRLEESEGIPPIKFRRIEASSSDSIEELVRNLFLATDDGARLTHAEIAEGAQHYHEVYASKLGRDTVRIEQLCAKYRAMIVELRAAAKKITRKISANAAKTRETVLAREPLQRHSDARRRLKGVLRMINTLGKAVRRQIEVAPNLAEELRQILRATTEIDRAIRKTRSAAWELYDECCSQMTNARKVTELISWLGSESSASPRLNYNVEEAVLDLTSAFDRFQMHLYDNSVLLATIHKAKGLEANRVVLLGFDKLPAHRQGQTREQRLQEWNLVYVALTRAMQSLTLVPRPEFDVTKVWPSVAVPLEEYRLLGRGLDVQAKAVSASVALVNEC